MALYDFTEYFCGCLMNVGLFIDDERSIKVVARSATVGLLDDSLYFKFGHTVPCIALQVVQAEERGAGKGDTAVAGDSGQSMEKRGRTETVEVGTCRA